MQHLQPNTLLQGGKYKIEKVLGQGGFGITYLAIQGGLERKVAVKEFFMKELCERDQSTSHVTLGSEGSRDTVNRFREKFLKEARLIAGMENHHIVRIYDIFEENGTAYYVMENIEGGSLDSFVEKHCLNESTALDYIRQVADALKYMHSQNILHLDVKPSNILIRKNGEAVLIDFGISKRYDDHGGQTSTTPAGISKGYAPTEQYNQGIANFSPATDIYSLGATLYKMLTGVTPPEASLLLNEDEELQKPDGISFKTWCAIEKSMEPKKKRRPQCIDDFLALIGSEGAASSPIDDSKEEDTIVIMSKENKSHDSEATLLEDPDSKNENSFVKKDKHGNLTFMVKGVAFKMIKVKPGTFMMGENHVFGWFSDNNATKVTLTKPFYIAETQVTQALWKAVMGENPSFYKEDECPVDSVSWNDCIVFSKELQRLTNKKFRLPTEAEWEYAAMGGKQRRGFVYSGSDNPGEIGWFHDNSYDHPKKVKQLKPNELGIYDMSGNVYEWCHDTYDSLSGIAVVDPVHNLDVRSSMKVCRGGAWDSYRASLAVKNRSSNVLSDKKKTLGMRLALTI